MSAALLEQRDRLAARLEDGWSRLAQAEEVGTNTSEWEVFWTKLLQEYEAVCRKLAEAHAISPVEPPLSSASGQLSLGAL